MALPPVQDFIHDWPGQAALQLGYGDEASPTGSGAIITRELRPPLWVLNAQSRRLRPNTLHEWQAKLETLENGKVLFWGYECMRFYPIAYPNGSWPTGPAFSGSAQLSAVDPNNKALVLQALPAGYSGRPGDMLSWAYNGDQYALHRVVEAFTANAGGVTNVFEVRPHIRPLAAAGTAVAVKRPACQMKLIPGSIAIETDPLGWGTIQFQAGQSL